jgi:hypothetical protein
MLLVSVTVFGCGATYKPKLFPVKGKVTVSGKPLTNCMIKLATLNPTKDTELGYFGKLNEKGEFNLSAPSGDPGAAVGKYKITFSIPPEEAMKAMMGGAGAKGKKNYDASGGFPPEYSSAQTSKKEVEIKPEPNDLLIEL